MNAVAEEDFSASSKPSELDSGKRLRDLETMHGPETQDI